MNMFSLHQWIVRRLLSAYVDGELSARECRAVERVLARNPRLAAECRELQQLNCLLNELAADALLTAENLKLSKSPAVPQRSRVWEWLAEWYDDLARDPLVAAGVLLLALIGGILSLLGGPPLVP